MEKAVPFSSNVLAGSRTQRSFAGRELNQIRFPVGGMGAGCVFLNGHGGLQDFSFQTGAMDAYGEARSAQNAAGFALLYLPDENVTRLVEGPYPVEKIPELEAKYQKGSAAGYEGLPRFHNCTFRGEFPFAYVSVTDPRIPLSVLITGWSPFIPLDDHSTSIPCAILEYTFENSSEEPVNYEFSYHLSHLAPGNNPFTAETSRNEEIPGSGVYYYNDETGSSKSFGSAALGVVGFSPQIKAMWYRGERSDAVSTLWQEVSTGRFTANDGSANGTRQGRNGGSIMIRGKLDPHQVVTYPILLTWYFPNSGEGNDKKSDQHSFVASHWKDAREVLRYVCEHYVDLRCKTCGFHDALFGSTLPSYVQEAISANLASLKAPFLWRDEAGDLYRWRLSSADESGTIKLEPADLGDELAFADLFPQASRRMLEREVKRSLDDRGMTGLFAAQTEGKTDGSPKVAVDGLLNEVLRVYREWKVKGDREWLLQLYPFARRNLDFCTKSWDPKLKGILEEPHWTRYGTQLWGPEGFTTGLYLGALMTMAEMAAETGHNKEADFYEELSQKGAGYLDGHLFNGDHYIQEITVEGLRDKSFAKLVAGVAEHSPVEEQLLKAEGPKYQIGAGILAEAGNGMWMAWQCFVDVPQNIENYRSHLKSVFANNFKPSLWEHANCQVTGSAIGEEPGLLVCTWPKGNRPTLPLACSDEVRSGVEYQAADQLISQGFLEEGLTLVAAARSRFNGQGRNPWGVAEITAEPFAGLASYGLLSAFSGVRYSGESQTLEFGPKQPGVHFKVFFSTASGYGTLASTGSSLVIQLLGGELKIRKVHLTRGGESIDLEVEVVVEAGKRSVIALPRD